MATEQLNLTKLIEAGCLVLNAFNFPIGSSIIERATANYENEPNNDQLLANLKQELIQLPPLTSRDISGEMGFFIQALIESIKATNVINKKFITRSVDKLYRGFEPFARNDTQHTALIEMQIAKEDVLGIELRHRVAHKLRSQANDHILWQQEDKKNEDLHMARELQAADY